MPLTLYKRGKIWHCRGLVAGVRVRRSLRVEKKDDAQREANRIESLVLKGRFDGPGAILTFADAATHYRKLGKVPRYLEMVEDYWKDMMVKEITRGKVREAAIVLFPKASGATRNRSVIVPTLAVINHCADLELCPPLRVKWFPVVKPKPKEPVTWVWVQAFMKHASPHLGALACFMLLTGARISEALAVTWDDMDLQRSRVTITMGKLDGEKREAHMPPALVAAIANIPSNRQPDATVFQYSSQHTAKYPWAAAARRAGIAPLTFHCCRHGFATALLHEGVDVVTIAKLGGWKSPEHVFKTYGHANKDDTLANRISDTQRTQRVTRKPKRSIVSGS